MEDMKWQMQKTAVVPGSDATTVAFRRCETQMCFIKETGEKHRICLCIPKSNSLVHVVSAVVVALVPEILV